MAKIKKKINLKNNKIKKAKNGKQKKPAAKKILRKAPKGKKEKLIGRVSHYFSDIKVGVIELSSPLKRGDKIRISGGKETDFEQKVSSMQIDHKEVKSAKKGNSIGLKLDEKARDGYKVYKA